MKKIVYYLIVIITCFACEQEEHYEITGKITTIGVVEITATTAVCKGSISIESNGNSKLVVTKGIIWSAKKSNIKDYASSEYYNSDNGSYYLYQDNGGYFMCQLTELKPATKYYVRTFAEIDGNYICGNIEEFTTLKQDASVQTLEVSNISLTEATFNGLILTVGNPAYTQCGFCYSTTDNPTIANPTVTASGAGTTGIFTANVTQLSKNTTYYVCAYARANNETPVYGDAIAFTTKKTELPSVTTQTPTNVEKTSATFNGTVLTVGSPAYTLRGFCYSTTNNPTISNSTVTASGAGTTGTFTANVTQLSENTTYYVCAYARANNETPVYGDAISFTTGEPSEMTVPAYGNNSYTTCSGTLYDNGGSSGNYTNNAYGYTVIYPATAGNVIELSGSYDTESNYDFIYVYDGAGTNGTLLGTYSGNGSLNITSLSGPVTVEFTSDASVEKSGFALTVSCIAPAQTKAQVRFQKAKAYDYVTEMAITTVSDETDLAAYYFDTSAGTSPYYEISAGEHFVCHYYTYQGDEGWYYSLENPYTYNFQAEHKYTVVCSDIRIKIDTWLKCDSDILI